MPQFGQPGEQIHYETRGSGPPLLLLHGFTTDASIFDANVDELAQRFTVITAELLGHGQSDTPENPDAYGPGPATGRLAALLDELGYERALITGHALGGTLGLRMALDHPDRVAGIVMINSTSAAGGPEWRERVAAQMADLAQRVRAGGMEVLRATRLNPERATRLPEPVRRSLVAGFEQLSPVGVANTAEALVPAVGAFERVGTLQVPVLIIVGELDQDFNETVFDLVAEMPADLANAVTLEETGHAGHIEQPEAFNAVVVEFAREIGYLPGDETSVS